MLFVFRDAKMKEMTVHKLEEMEKKLGDADKSRGQTDRDLKTVRKVRPCLRFISIFQFLTAELDKQKLYIDSSMDSVRKLQESESEKLRLRLVDVNDSMNEIDSSIAEVKPFLKIDILLSVFTVLFLNVRSNPTSRPTCRRSCRRRSPRRRCWTLRLTTRGTS